MNDITTLSVEIAYLSVKLFLEYLYTDFGFSNILKKHITVISVVRILFEAEDSFKKHCHALSILFFCL